VSDLGNTGFSDDSGTSPPSTSVLTINWFIMGPTATATVSDPRFYASSAGSDSKECGFDVRTPCRTLQASSANVCIMLLTYA
jgi:hypothetical protein